MQKKSDEIINTIRNDIIEGRLSDKDFLSESELAEKFGVSKGPVKEAMHILCQEGYLIGYPRRGYMVNSYSREDYRQVDQLRSCIEEMCVRSAIERATDEELRALKDSLNEKSTERSPLKTNNTKFHLHVAELSGNKFAVSTLKSLLGITSIGYITMPTDNELHEKIVDAMLSRDAERAIHYIKLDIKES